jgi:hypothetical protein
MRQSNCVASARARHFSVLAAIIFATLASLLLARQTLAAGFNFRTADFSIMSAANAQPIGHVHYDVNQSRPGAETVTSDARYASGDYDIEHDEFDTRKGSIAILVRYEHNFFHAGGVPFLATKADFQTGRAWCTAYANGAPVVTSKTLAFPPDTYAGAAMILPLQNALQAGDTGPIILHDFVCMPGPELVTVQAEVGPPEPWKHYSSAVVRTDIKPDLGWLGYVVAPFLPEMHAWFSPTDGFDFVGGQFTRFYRGPEIIIARQQASPAAGLAAHASAPPTAAH